MSDDNYHQLLAVLGDISGAIVEIGCGRSSTAMFAAVAACDHRFFFHAVDLDDQAIGHAHRVASRLSRMAVHQMDGTAFFRQVLPGYQQEICYAYLDNHDWNWYEDTPDIEPDWIREQRMAYESAGLVYTNAASSAAHLDQTQALLPMIAERCIIQYDDTHYRDGSWRGKGATAIPYLMSKDWVVIEHGDASVTMANYGP